MRLDLFKIFLVAALAFAIAFAGAPWFAFRALRAATAAEDVQAVAELVDFPAVRKSLEGQLVPARASTAEPPSVWKDPLGALKRAIEPLAPPEPKVDRYLTLPGLSALTRGYAPGKAPPPAGGVQPLDVRIKAAAKGPWPTVAYWDPNRTRIAVKRPETPDKVTVFTFERRALFTWKLVHVQLPEDER
ncbi:MAG: DUF2939 domain-containing protein [Pseudomonadota bacterium]